MEGTSRCTLGSQAQHTHSLEYHTRYIQQSTSTHTQHVNNIQQQKLRTTTPNLTVNSGRTTCTLFTPPPAVYNSNLDLKINNTALSMTTHPGFWVLP